MPKFVMSYEDDCGSYTETVTKFFDPDVEYETQDEPTWRCLLKYFVEFLEKAGYVLGDGTKEKFNDLILEPMMDDTKDYIEQCIKEEDTLADVLPEKFENPRNIPCETYDKEPRAKKLAKFTGDVKELCKNLDEATFIKALEIAEMMFNLREEPILKNV